MSVDFSPFAGCLLLPTAAEEQTFSNRGFGPQAEIGGDFIG
jgi:hypothetical protein